MTEIEERDASAEEYEEGERRTSPLLVLIVLLIIGAIVGVVMHQIRTKTYNGYKVISENEMAFDSAANYIVFSDNLLKYSSDGVSYINKSGDIVWTAGINMNMPKAVARGDYAVVADLRGNLVCVFDREGEVSNETMPYAICDVDIAKQGAFAVVLESDKTNYINLYNKLGELVYEMQTTIDKSGYPLDISISEDGKKLFTSYISVGANGIENRLAAYNFGDVGQNSNADRMVGGYNMDGETVAKLCFVDNDTVVAFGTSSISIYSMKELPSQRATIEVSKPARSIFYDSEIIGFVQEANELVSGTNTDAEDAAHKYKITAYNLKGSKSFERYIDFDYENVSACRGELMITGGSECLILRSNGSVKYSGVLDGHIVSIVPGAGKNEYVVVYDTRTELIKLKSGANKVTEEEAAE